MLDPAPTAGNPAAGEGERTSDLEAGGASATRGQGGVRCLRGGAGSCDAGVTRDGFAEFQASAPHTGGGADRAARRT